jgi:hypothetical protein
MTTTTPGLPCSSSAPCCLPRVPPARTRPPPGMSFSPPGQRPRAPLRRRRPRPADRSRTDSSAGTHTQHHGPAPPARPGRPVRVTGSALPGPCKALAVNRCCYPRTGQARSTSTTWTTTRPLGGLDSDFLRTFIGVSRRPSRRSTARLHFALWLDDDHGRAAVPGRSRTSRPSSRTASRPSAAHLSQASPQGRRILFPRGLRP